MLRTKAMREKEEQRERRKYNYTLLRIRLPDGNLLQGNKSNNKSRQSSDEVPDGPRGECDWGFDSRHFLCVGSAPRAVRVCAGVFGGRLAAL